MATVRDAKARPVVAIANSAEAALDSITGRAVARILGTADAYVEVGTVGDDDLRRSVRSHIVAVLQCLREHRLLDDHELESRRELGAVRAGHHMPVTDVMRAFRVGYVELWEELLAIASRIGPDAEIDLLQSASIVWTTLDQISSAVAEGHREAVARAEVDLRRLALSFVAGLRRHPVDADETTRHARDLGLTPDGPFLIAVVAGGPVPLPGLVVETPQGAVVVQQGEDGDAPRQEPALVAELSSVGLTRAGVGLAESGLGGAAASLRQAERALALSMRLEHPVSFRDEWLMCIVLDQARDVTSVLGPAIDLLARDDTLRETLAAYLDAHGQLAAAGAHLFVHPNTVAYRIGRFHARTGVDPRLGTGATVAWLALQLARIGPIA